MALTQVDQGLLSTNAQYTGFKNRLINSAMVIDQRNAGASVTQSTSLQYPVDRYFIYGTVASKFTAQRNAGSVTPPTGFTNYLGITSSSAYSVLTGDVFGTAQRIEGFNTADLAWGTASAQTATLSFWVRCSLTGTFGGAFQNNSQDRSYTFAYTINSANTWEQKSITIAGDNSGTWATDNSTGIGLIFGLGAGSTFSATAGAWGAGNKWTVTGATSVVGTNGATFYITGVQLEKGSTATSFDYRPYGTELALCQRYYQILGAFVGVGTTTTKITTYFPFMTIMRSSPSVTTGGVIKVTDGVAADYTQSSSNIAIQSGTASRVTDRSIGVEMLNFSGLTVYRTYSLVPNESLGLILLSAEL